MVEGPRATPRTLSFVVAANALPDRIDRAVVRYAERQTVELSRARVQRLLGRGHVRVNGEIASDAALIVRSGSRIELTLAAEPQISAAADPTVPFEIVYEDAWLAVLDKPAGVVVHPAKGHATGTLVNGLVARGLAPADAGDGDPVRPGIVHRLDKGTSGLLVVAKDVTTQAALKDRFSRHEIDREYVAIVVGRADARTIETMHGRHPTDRLRFTSRPRGPSKRAVTHVRVLERLKGATLVACTLETGRTHQIRVHLSEVSGTPILGDPLYGSRPSDARIAAIGAELGHQALHARVLGFEHPVLRMRVRWEAPPPNDFRSALEALGR